MKSHYLAAAGLLFAGMLGGLGMWGTYEGVTTWFTSNTFCVSCHEMRTMADDYRHSIHYANPAGVRAQCADCHVPKPFVARIVHMIFATRDLVGHVRGVIDTPEKLDARRLDMAKSVWAEMTANGSLGCRSCHGFEAMDFARQRPEAAKAMHGPMRAGASCIDCHHGIAHRLAFVAEKPVAAVRPVAPATPPAEGVGEKTPRDADAGSVAGTVVVASPGTPPLVPPARTAMPPAPQTTASITPSTGTSGFIGEATTPLGDPSGGAPFATLFVSAPVTVTATEADGSHIVAKLWMKGDAVTAGPLFAAPEGVEVGRLDTPGAAKAGTARDGWIPVELTGTTPPAAVVGNLDATWGAAESTYEFTCAGCHVLHAAEAYTPAQWGTEMSTMAKSANLRPDDAMVLLKWLQTTSFNHQTAK